KRTVEHESERTGFVVQTDQHHCPREVGVEKIGAGDQELAGVGLVHVIIMAENSRRPRVGSRDAASVSRLYSHRPVALRKDPRWCSTPSSSPSLTQRSSAA